MSKFTTLIIAFAVITITFAEKGKETTKPLKEDAKTDKKQDKRGLFDLGYGYGGGYESINHYGLNDFSGLDHGHHLHSLPHVHEQVTVEKHVPYPVKVPVAVPVAVPVDRPYPVHVPKPYPVHIEKHIPYPVEKPIPYAVKVPVKVPVAHPVPYPVPKPYPVHVEKHVPYPVAQPVYIEKEVPVLIKDHDHYNFGHADLNGYGLGAFGNHETLHHY